MRVTKSDIDQLVVGYVSEERYFETRNKIFQESPNLPERVPILSLFGDISSENRLLTILDEYVLFKTKQLSPICSVCDDHASVSDLWKTFDKIVNKIKNYKEKPVPLPQRPVTPELQRYSPSQFSSENSRTKSNFRVYGETAANVPDFRSIQRKILNPISNEFEPELNIRQKNADDATRSRCMDSGRRKKTSMPRRFNNNSFQVASFNNEPPLLYAHNGDLSKLLNTSDNNDALALVGVKILKNMKKCAGKGENADNSHNNTTASNSEEINSQRSSPTKYQTAATLDIDDLISDETRGGLVEMTIESLLNPDLDALAGMETSTVQNIEEDFSELRKLLELDDSSSSRFTLPDLIQTKQDEKYLIDIINAPTDQDLPGNPTPMDYEQLSTTTNSNQVCEQPKDEKFDVTGLLAMNNTSKSNETSCDSTVLEKQSPVSVCDSLDMVPTAPVGHPTGVVLSTAVSHPIGVVLNASVSHPVEVVSTASISDPLGEVPTEAVCQPFGVISTACVSEAVDEVIPPMVVDIPAIVLPMNSPAAQSMGVTKASSVQIDTINNKEPSSQCTNENANMDIGIATLNVETGTVARMSQQNEIPISTIKFVTMPPKKRFLAKENASPRKHFNIHNEIEASQVEQNLDSSVLTGELLIDETSDQEMQNADPISVDILQSSDSITVEKFTENVVSVDDKTEQEKLDLSAKSDTENAVNSSLETTQTTPRKSKRQHKTKFFLKDIIGKRRDVSKNSKKRIISKEKFPTKKKSQNEKKNDVINKTTDFKESVQSNIDDEITEPSVQVIGPGHGSVVINLKDRGRMPIHVKGIVVHTEKNKPLSTEDIISKLVGQMKKPSGDDTTLEKVISEKTNKGIAPTLSVESPSDAVMHKVSSEVEAEPSYLTSIQNTSISQYLPTQSCSSLFSQKSNFTALLSTPPKLSYSKQFSTISPSAGIFSVIGGSITKSPDTNLHPTSPSQFTTARNNLLQSFVHHESSVSCVTQNLVENVNNKNDAKQIDYTDLTTVVMATTAVDTQNQISSNTKSANGHASCNNTQQTYIVPKKRAQMTQRKVIGNQQRLKKRERNIYLCSKMKNMVKIEPKRFGVPAVRRCIVQTTPEQLEMVSNSGSQVLSAEVMKTYVPVLPVHEIDNNSQSIGNTMDFDKFFDFNNEVGKKVDTAVSCPTTMQIEQASNTTEKFDQTHSNTFSTPDKNTNALHEKFPPADEKNKNGDGSTKPNSSLSQIDQSKDVGSKKTSDKKSKNKKSRRKKKRSESCERKKKKRRSTTESSPLSEWSYDEIQAKLNAIHGIQQERKKISLECEKKKLQPNLNKIYNTNEEKNAEESHCFIREEEIKMDTADKKSCVQNTDQILYYNLDEKETLSKIIPEEVANDVSGLSVSQDNSNFRRFFGLPETSNEYVNDSVVQSKEGDHADHHDEIMTCTRPVVQLEPLDLSLPGWTQTPKKNTFMCHASDVNKTNLMLQEKTMTGPDTSTPHAAKNLFKSCATLLTHPKSDEAEEKQPLANNKENCLKQNEDEFHHNIINHHVPISHSTPILKNFSNNSESISGVVAAQRDNGERRIVEPGQSTPEKGVKIKKRSRKKRKKDRLSMLMKLSQQDIKAKLALLHGNSVNETLISHRSQNSELSNDSRMSVESRELISEFNPTQINELEKNLSPRDGVDVPYSNENLLKSSEEMSEVEAATLSISGDNIIETFSANSRQTPTHFKKQTLKSNDNKGIEPEKNDQHRLLLKSPLTTVNIETIMSNTTPSGDHGVKNQLKSPCINNTPEEVVQKQKTQPDLTKKTSLKSKSTGKVSKHKTKDKKLDKLKNLDIQKFLASIRYEK